MTTRRALTIDDPVAGRQPCHVAHPTGGDHIDHRLRQIPVDEIQPNPAQPRKRLDQAALGALAASIRERGVLQPIIVRPGEAGGFEIVAGERRWRAAQLAGLQTIPALVDDHDTDASPLELALIENMVREDLTPVEEARTIALLLNDLQVTATELANRLGRSRTDLVHTVLLLELPDQALDLINDGALSKGHGKTLLTEPDHHRRRQLARQGAQRGWSVRALEAEIARSQKPRSSHAELHPDHQATAVRLQDALARVTGCDVQARPHRDGYTLVINRHAAARLAQLLESAPSSA